MFTLDTVHSNILILAGPSVGHLCGSTELLHKMHSNSNVRCSRWSWNADSVHSYNWIVSGGTLSVFQLYLEHLTTFGMYVV